MGDGGPAFSVGLIHHLHTYTCLVQSPAVFNLDTARIANIEMFFRSLNFVSSQPPGTTDPAAL